MSAREAQQGARVTLDAALARIAGRARGYDRDPRLPRENVEDLLAAGALQDAILCNCTGPAACAQRQAR